LGDTKGIADLGDEIDLGLLIVIDGDPRSESCRISVGERRQVGVVDPASLYQDRSIRIALS